MTARGVDPDLHRFVVDEQDRLVGMLALYVGDRSIAEELAQDAVVRLCQHWPRVRHMDNRRAWLNRVAINLAETVGSAGCLSSGSAYALAAAAGRLLDELDPQAGWSAAEVAEERIAADGPPARSADCTSVLFAVTEFGIEEYAPTILLVPAWVD